MAVVAVVDAVSGEGTPPRSVTWNSERHRWDWSATSPEGTRFTGYADTESEARHDMNTDWRVRGDKPRFVGPRGPVIIMPLPDDTPGRPGEAG